MREIKFCIGVKNEAGEVSEVILTIDELLDKGLKCEGCDILYKRQFAGKQDADGADIYEGDIVEGFDRNGEKVWSHKLVIYKSSSFGLKVLGYREYRPFCEIDKVEWKIVGNIHQNPELLK